MRLILAMKNLAIVVVPSILSAATPARADSLPIERGYFVQSDTACQRASNATITLYNGVSFGGAHMECGKPKVRQLPDGAYEISKRCRDIQGHRGPWENLTSTYVIVSRTEFTATTAFGKGSYRYCKQSDLPEPWSKNDVSAEGGVK